ncbi:hypothetical protein LCGC14_2915250 [marine sediment metagenome]|uniref:NADAR domain-containing protein n=1 Tax=marine sediment metagenome TaxID=412755 RepID=A0A0F8ZY18_9ZZZZ
MNELNSIEGQEIIEFYRTDRAYGFLSNLYKKPVIFKGREFPTPEHAYQFGKFKDEDTREWAMKAPKPHLLAILAHGLFSWDIVEDWSKIKVDRMYQVLKVKFADLDLRQQLLETGNSLLLENSKTDSFWGKGKKSNGKNMLGKLLMQVRAEIKCGLCEFYNNLITECEAYVNDPQNCNESKKRENELKKGSE